MSTDIPHSVETDADASDGSGDSDVVDILFKDGSSLHSMKLLRTTAHGVVAEYARGEERSAGDTAYIPWTSIKLVAGASSQLHSLAGDADQVGV